MPFPAQRSSTGATQQISNRNDAAQPTHRTISLEKSIPAVNHAGRRACVGYAGHGFIGQDTCINPLPCLSTPQISARS